MKPLCLQLVWFIIAGLACARPASIILDTDMAGDCDDAGALAVLHALADLGEAGILAIVTNRRDRSNASAAACSAINHYYGRPDIPIGTDKDGAKTGRGRPSPYAPALRDEFPHSALPDDEMPDALTIYRKTLAAQPDNSVVICSIGLLSNLEDLIRSQPDEFSSLNGLELIRKKVKSTVIMGGGFPRTRLPETNLRLDPAAVVTVVNEWPGPILWSGFEIGAALFCGEPLKQLSSDNPVRRSFELRPYRDGFAIDKGKPAHDQAAVLLAVRGAQPEYWELISDGRVVADSDGHTVWKNDRNRAHSYVKIKQSPDPIATLIDDLMIAPPKR